MPLQRSVFSNQQQYGTLGSLGFENGIKTGLVSARIKLRKEKKLLINKANISHFLYEGARLWLV